MGYLFMVNIPMYYIHFMQVPHKSSWSAFERGRYWFSISITLSDSQWTVFLFLFSSSLSSLPTDGYLSDITWGNLLDFAPLYKRLYVKFVTFVLPYTCKQTSMCQISSTLTLWCFRVIWGSERCKSGTELSFCIGIKLCVSRMCRNVAPHTHALCFGTTVRLVNKQLVLCAGRMSVCWKFGLKHTELYSENCQVV